MKINALLCAIMVMWSLHPAVSAPPPPARKDPPKPAVTTPPPAPRKDPPKPAVTAPPPAPRKDPPKPAVTAPPPAPRKDPPKPAVTALPPTPRKDPPNPAAIAPPSPARKGLPKPARMVCNTCVRLGADLSQSSPSPKTPSPPRAKPPTISRSFCKEAQAYMSTALNEGLAGRGILNKNFTDKASDCGLISATTCGSIQAGADPEVRNATITWLVSTYGKDFATMLGPKICRDMNVSRYDVTFSSSPINGCPTFYATYGC